MMLIEKIRRATQPMHEALDKTMTPHIESIQSTEEYIQLLTAFYGFFKPMYDKIDEHLQTSFLPDYGTRRKPVDILKNLVTLHYNYPIQIFSTNLPTIENNAAAFGALYVLEGSTLGGLLIKKMIAAQTGLHDEQLSFFEGYGKQTRERWNRFIDAVNALPTHSNEEQTIKAASDTFAQFSNWIHTFFES